jgi:hypothetical protein
MANVDRILEVEMRRDRRKVIGVVIHIVTVRRLTRASVTTAIMCNDAEAMTQEEHHLRVPIIAGQRPTV